MNDETLINQSLTACTSFEARIENGADPTEALQWLREELADIAEGIIVYENL